MLERWSHLPTYKRRRAERHADAPAKEATVVQGPPDTVRVRDVYVPTKPVPPALKNAASRDASTASMYCMPTM